MEERRHEGRYIGHEEDIASAKAHMLEMIEKMQGNFNEFASDELNQKINQVKHDYDSIHRLADLELGRQHLEELLEQVKVIVTPDFFDELMNDLNRTDEAIKSRLVEANK